MNKTSRKRKPVDRAACLLSAKRKLASISEKCREVSAAYDYVFSLIQKEQKQGVGHLHLLIIEDSINSTSKELKRDLERAIESVAHYEALQNQVICST